jgi:hypothetical protein
VTKAAKGRTHAEIMALAKPREAVVKICVAGDLAAEADRLTVELAVLKDKPGTSLADGAERARVQSELDEVAALMREAEIEYRFRALPRRDRSDLIAAHPGRTGEDEEWNLETFPAALVAACAVEPTMSPSDVDQLFDVLNEDGCARLFNGAWRANQAPTSIPT